MNNNDILRRLRYAFDFTDVDAVSFFSLDPSSNAPMDKPGYLARLIKDEDPSFVLCTDGELCAFLDGFVVHQRGLREPAPAPQPSKPDDFRLSKNDVLKKLRIALTFREEDMLETLEIGGSTLSRGELGALFRKPGHKHYRACGNQVLRNFIKGLTEQIRGE
ncbi:DUF1456 family protein [Arenicella sp. 4NH20-0111]|uniref:DUF1456 family protein n=1 Tax=Arenicella sp. 4NH20-0111 TaxID=3127648 RepID=UPI003104DE46